MRERRFRALPVAMVIVAAYLLAFPFPLQKEIVLVPSWSVDLETAAVGSPDGPMLPFRLGPRLGYYTLSGTIVNMEPVIYDAALSRSIYINYSRVPANLVLKDPLGSFVGSLRSGLYPILDRTGERLLLVHELATGLSETGRDGQQLWRRDFGSVITTVDLDPTRTLMGFLDGTLVLLDRSGHELFTAAGGDSRYRTVYGVALGPDAIACIRGLDPQRVEIFELRDGAYVLSRSVALRSDLRREARILFTGSGNTIYFEQEGAVGRLDRRSGRLERLEAPGVLDGLVQIAEEDVIAMAYSRAGVTELRVLQGGGVPVARLTLPSGEERFVLDRSEQGLLVGYGTTLTRLEIRRE